MSLESLIFKLKSAFYSLGPTGLYQFGRLFSPKYDGKLRYLEYGNYEKAITEYGLKWNRDEIRLSFDLLDRNRTGKIDYDEFLYYLRVRLINLAFIFLIKKTTYLATNTSS
jgi:hypothetical protein